MIGLRVVVWVYVLVVAGFSGSLVLVPVMVVGAYLAVSGWDAAGFRFTCLVDLCEVCFSWLVWVVWIWVVWGLVDLVGFGFECRKSCFGLVGYCGCASLILFGCVELFAFMG